MDHLSSVAALPFFGMPGFVWVGFIALVLLLLLMDLGIFHGKPHEIAGYTGSQEAGSSLVPPDYQKLGGPWVNGKDPAAG